MTESGLLGRVEDPLAKAFAKGRELGRTKDVHALTMDLIRLMDYSWQPYIPSVGGELGFRGRRLELPRGLNEGAIEEQIRELVKGYASARPGLQGQKDIVMAYKAALTDLAASAEREMKQRSKEVWTLFVKIKEEITRERPGISAADLKREATRKLNDDLRSRSAAAHGELVGEFRAASGRWDGQRYVGGYYERMQKRARLVLEQLDSVEKALNNPIKATEVLGKMARKLGVKGAAATALAAAVAGYLIYQTLKPEEVQAPKKVGEKKMDF